jgi:hypothetical protein
MTTERKIRVVFLCLFVWVLYLAHWRIQTINQRIDAIRVRLAIVESNAVETTMAAKQVWDFFNELKALTDRSYISKVWTNDLTGTNWTAITNKP